MNVSPADIAALAPELLLTCGALLLMLSEAFLRGERRGYQAVLTAASAAAALAAFAVQSGTGARSLFGGFAVTDRFSMFVGATVCAGLFATSLLGAGFLRARSAERGEFYALSLLAAVGMCLLARANDLLFVFIALEVMSVSTYPLAGYLRQGPRPSEAAFKYFILGAFSSALFLYGTALCFGDTGKTSLTGIAAAMSGAGGGPLLVAGLVFVLAGLAFKVAAVPFHMWAPDVYEGAPTPVTGFMAVGVKAAAFAVLLRVLFVGFGPPHGAQSLAGPATWRPLIIGLAVLTMVGGNLMALTQRNVKRMLAYSSIAHAGYLLVAVAAGAQPAARGEAITGLLFYLAAYTATTAGAFAGVAAIERLSGDDFQPWDLDRFAGLGKRRPWAAAAIAVLMLSLAGIPPTAGFMGKLLVFRAAVDAGLVPLAIVGMLSAVIGLYYYLRVVGVMYMQPAPEGSLLVPANGQTDLVLAGSALAVLAIGLAPAWLATAAAAATGLFGG